MYITDIPELSISDIIKEHKIEMKINDKSKNRDNQKPLR